MTAMLGAVTLGGFSLAEAATQTTGPTHMTTSVTQTSRLTVTVQTTVPA